MARCGLCLQNKVLKKSHLMPKSLYKTLRNAFPGSGKDLVLSSTKKGTSAITDYQVKVPFLCGDCEQLISKKGENLVCPECHHGASFTLLDHVKQAKPLFTDGGERWINPTDSANSHLNLDAYLYFGASVIWRASAGRWPALIGNTYGSLAAKYQEELRQYLLGETPFPMKIYLAVYVDSDPDIVPVMTFPSYTKHQGHHSHVFYIPGVKFLFLIGSQTGDIGDHFIQQNTSIMFVEYLFKNTADFRLIHGKTVNELQPKGRLAKTAQAVKKSARGMS